MADDTLRLQIDIAPADAKLAFELFGSRGIGVAVAALTQEANQEILQETAADNNSRHGGEWMRQLIASGVFNPRTGLKEWMSAFGPDEVYQAFVRTKTSCITNKTDTIYAHVRRTQLDGNGTGKKPYYSGVPLTHQEHWDQSNHGEKGCLDIHHSDIWSVEQAKDWFDKQSTRYRILFAKQAIVDWYNNLDCHPEGQIQSCAEISPYTLFSFFMSNDTGHLLPEKLREKS